MIPSCARYLSKALALHAELERRGAIACIVTGDPSLTGTRDDGVTLQVPVADTYEALPAKVLEGLVAVGRKYGSVAVLKLDDDCTVQPSFDPVRLSALALAQPYTGVPVTGAECDRCWHVGKTSVPMAPYGKRVRGAWARGAAYLLGPRAVELLRREWMLFPGEFAGEIYEDKMIGDFLRRQSIEVTPTSHAVLGIDVDMADRPAAPVAAATFS